MDPITVGLIYAVAGSAILAFVSKIMKCDFELSAIMLSCAAAGACAALIPNNGAGLISLVAMLAVLKFTTNEEWDDLIIPVFITRLLLVPALLLVGEW